MRYLPDILLPSLSSPSLSPRLLLLPLMHLPSLPSQWLGFILTAVFLAACAGSHDFLLDPNYTNTSGGARSYWVHTKGQFYVL
jgi:hypothetical protein